MSSKNALFNNFPLYRPDNCSEINTLSDFSNKKYLYTTHNGSHDYTVLATAYQLAHQGRRSAKASGHLAETCGM